MLPVLLMAMRRLLVGVSPWTSDRLGVERMSDHLLEFYWESGYCDDPGCCAPEPRALCTCGEVFYGCLDKEDAEAAHLHHLKVVIRQKEQES